MTGQMLAQPQPLPGEPRLSKPAHQIPTLALLGLPEPDRLERQLHAPATPPLACSQGVNLMRCPWLPLRHSLVPDLPQFTLLDHLPVQARPGRPPVQCRARSLPPHGPGRPEDRDAPSPLRAWWRFW